LIPKKAYTPTKVKIFFLLLFSITEQTGSISGIPTVRWKGMSLFWFIYFKFKRKPEGYRFTLPVDKINL